LSNSHAITPQTGKYEIGPTLDLVPYVLADGYTINLTAKLELSEFLGYASTTNRIYTTNKLGKRISVPAVRPEFRTQDTQTTLNVWDGQTVVLGRMVTTATNNVVDKVPVLGSIPLVGRLFQSQSKQVVKKNLMVFVTATIVDPAGNRVHSDNEMRQIQEKTKSYSQPQPQTSSPSR